MRYSLLSILILIMIPTSSFGQAASSDSQTLRALLEEVRQLRHDLQSSTAMAQRAQIALYRLQRQDEAVARAGRRLDDAHLRVAESESGKNKKLTEIQEAKAQTERNSDPNAQAGFEQVVLPHLKSQLQMLEKQEQEARAEESAAEQQLRDEQTKLDALNDTLDRLNNALEEASVKR